MSVEERVLRYILSNGLIIQANWLQPAAPAMYTDTRGWPVQGSFGREWQLWKSRVPRLASLGCVAHPTSYSAFNINKPFTQPACRPAQDRNTGTGRWLSA